MTVNRYIDHTLLKPAATPDDIARLCGEAVTYQFRTVCINSSYTALARDILSEHPGVGVCVVAGFPLGAMSSRAKLYEAQIAAEDGADEIDMVLHLGWLKSGRTAAVVNEIAAVKKIMGNRILKVILETCFLSDEEKILACTLAVDGGADFVKTSTGFGTGGATPGDIALMKKAVNGRALLKASGGIKTLDTAQEYIAMGVQRIGTSGGVAIMKGLASNESY
ncbi:deoxyribose-phosphate aldolase [Sinomicrobium soli]|uniref:deoxyribose-phosphate aldolase n=1 Tax=Sinomicrobium sp. N-1-3-6 TaxID=2219864 RepID=UPI000DCCB3C6|nr:deoxyribose-phosphate aldolase [Sinomicrobium sp. N-1-3-6]RAV29298.1 deoxyribose-phosphate aldolase [Sinomicrobium sp. N-1-3-6]